MIRRVKPPSKTNLIGQLMYHYIVPIQIPRKPCQEAKCNEKEKLSKKNSSF